MDFNKKPKKITSVGDADRSPIPSGPTPEGGMIVTPEHPMFQNQDSRVGDSRPTQMPPGAVPPGARFDPITPFGLFAKNTPHSEFDPLGSGIGPFPGKNSRPPGGFDPLGSGIAPFPGNPFAPNPQNKNKNKNFPSGDPDFDEMLPPGFDDE